MAHSPTPQWNWKNASARNSGHRIWERAAAAIDGRTETTPPSGLDPVQLLGFVEGGVPGFGEEARLRKVDFRNGEQLARFQQRRPQRSQIGDGIMRAALKDAQTVLEHFDAEVRHFARP